jgi:hypothetical protein
LPTAPFPHTNSHSRSPTTPRFPFHCAGPRKLYFKRHLRVPGNLAEQEEDAAAGPEAAAHRLAFADAAHHFLHGKYRCGVPAVVSLSTLLLQSLKGTFVRATDTASRVQ